MSETAPVNISFSTDETLAQKPFPDSIEIAAVAGLPERTARRFCTGRKSTGAPAWCDTPVLTTFA